MNKSPLSLVLSLSALLGGALMLPQEAAAHDKDSQRDHHRHEQAQLPQHHHRGEALNDWYLLHHRESRPYGYRPLKRVYLMNGTGHDHRHHPVHSYRHIDVAPQPRVQHSEPLHHLPVAVELSYHIVL